MAKPRPEKTIGLEESIERPNGAVGARMYGEERDDAKSVLPLELERGAEPVQSMNKHPRRVADNTSKKDMQKKRRSAQ